MEDKEIELLKLRYEILCAILKREKERDKTVESKASLFIGTTSIVGAVLVGCVKLVSDEKGDDTCLNTIILLFMLVLVSLLSFAIWHSIRVLQKRKYCMLGIEDLGDTKTEKEHYLKLIDATIKIIKYNEPIINAKVDSMEMAQRRFIDFGLFSIIYVTVLLIYKLLTVLNTQIYLTLAIIVFHTIIFAVIGKSFVRILRNKQNSHEVNNADVERQIKVVSSVSSDSASQCCKERN